MNEIEKLYENAKVEPQYKKRIECKDGCTVGHPCQKGIACINCNKSVFEDVMPPFTAEKQLELIKFLFNHNVWFHISDDCYTYYYNKIEIILANIINEMWQDLTEEERKQIKEILE